MTYLLQIRVDEEIKAKLETNDPYIIRDFVFSQKDILSKPKATVKRKLVVTVVAL